MAEYQSTSTPAQPTTPIIPEQRMRSALTDALYELENRVVRTLSSVIVCESFMRFPEDQRSASCLQALATRNIATALGSVARIIIAIEDAAK